ncbi:hypothetical protein COV18_07345 [Candidatus Woesearchaeota archaeon CG10_big_fil_rev_8_21_14_0_10_37_12]|nr:MAG: hypothetical protein COV18_07345 [Candidatus Woesearchaeota archaeon CG10_big_fil_rev_8_21_14_0_10_37_12]
MSFITKNANIVLLFLIVLSAVALVGATVFFQMNFEDINKEYDTKLEQLRKVSEELEQQRTLLGQTKSELSVKAEREEELGERFTEVRSTNEQLSQDKERLESSKQSLENELDNTESLLRSAQSEIEAKRDTINVLTQENDDLKDQLDTCERKREKAEDDLDECLDDKAQCTCPA